MKNNVISLSKFLSLYANLEGEELVNMTHEEVKSLFPHFKRTNFEYVEKNERELLNGNVLLVSDGKKIIPYFAPTVVQEDEKITVIREYEQKQQGEKITDYTRLSEYELKRLLRTKFNTPKCKNNARKELEKRGIVLKRKYNRNKMKNEGEY